MNTPTAKALDESSPSVQTHLGILQGVISRMASNSAACKGSCITIVSAILVVVADKSLPNLAYIALIPTALFMLLDAYYLALEKGFRQSYNNFIGRLHNGQAGVQDLFSVAPLGSTLGNQFKAILSVSVWGFYVFVAILIYLTRTAII